MRQFRSRGLVQAPGRRWLGLAFALVACVGGLALPRQAAAQGNTIPSTGTLRVLPLRIQFVPAPRTVVSGNPPVSTTTQLPATRFPSFCDEAYYKTALNEVKKYFKEVSGGKLDLTIPNSLPPVVTETVYDHDEAYYAGNATIRDARADELIQRAMELSEAAVDFSRYDLVIVFHAGGGQEATGSGADILSQGRMGAFTGDGKTFGGAVLQAALEPFNTQGNTALGYNYSMIGRLCMGIMQAIGPGAVRTGSGAGTPGESAIVGVWDLMDRGWTLGPLSSFGRADWSKPSHPNPYEKVRMGWITPVQVTRNTAKAAIPQMESTGAVCYKLWRAGQSGTEYFLVENRQATGWDGQLPNSGLLIWHINEAMPDQSDSEKLRVRLLQADGTNDIEGGTNYGDGSDCFPGTKSAREVSDNTTPSTKDSNGSATDVTVNAISEPSEVMTANLYIAPPMIASVFPGADSVTESVVPIFKVTFAATSTGTPLIDPNSITLALDGAVVVDKSNLSQYYNAGTRTLTYQTPQLAFAQHTLNVSVKNATGTVTESTGDIPFRVNFRTLPAGLRMVSVPYALTGPNNTSAVVFGSSNLKLARYVPGAGTAGTYHYYPEGTNTALAPAPGDPAGQAAGHRAPAGLAYWVRLPVESPVHINGEQLDLVGYRIPLGVGWNMVGNPFPFAVDWNGVQVEYQGVTRPLQDAANAGWISPTLYSYGTGGYSWESAPHGQLRPWEGYWVYTSAAVTLVVPPMPSGTSRVAPGRSKSAKGEWTLRLVARASNGAADTGTIIGVSRAAQDGADAGDVAKPPMPAGGTIAVRLLDGGRSLAQDMRGPEVGTGKTWEFEVSTDLKQESITLNWPDLSALPRGLNLTLEDTATGRRVYARTSSAYTYNSGDGGTRRFRVTVAPRSVGLLAVTDISLRRTRGVPTVSFTLNREAQVTVELVSPSGQTVRRMAVDHQGQAGTNAVSGSRAEGLASGLYMVQITAVAADGATVRAVQPMMISR